MPVLVVRQDGRVRKKRYKGRGIHGREVY